MNKLKPSLNTIAGIAAMASVAVVMSSLTSQAAPFAPLNAADTAAKSDSLIQNVDYFYEGHRYCWYYEGWHGPGWYWCGYAWRRGYGWGSPIYGWNDWAWRGPRLYRGREFRERGRIDRDHRRH